MPDVPGTGQLVLLYAAAGIFTLALLFSLLRFFNAEKTSLRTTAKVCIYLGILMGIAVITWRALNRHSWLPLDDNFDALIWLGLLLALFLTYMQRAHPLGGLDLFLLPIVVLVLVLAGIFGRTKPRAYLETTWSLTHLIAAFGGVVAFAVAAAGGVMYLVKSQQLRRKKMLSGQGLGSLERIEHLTFVSVSLGFALLTVGLVTGLVRAIDTHGHNSLGPDWYRNPKVLLAFIAWIVYALVLHSPINPSFRGRRAAILSVVGFVLMIGTVVAVQYMPSH
jgi:ABC-type uncharacterized transport system permease subunit